MPNHRKASDFEIAEAYAEAKSVWGAARRLGMCGQSVHERLVKLGVPLRNPIFAPEEERQLVMRYDDAAATGTLGKLAAEMGRSKQFLCRKARELGLTNRERSKFYLAEGIRERAIAWHQNNEHPRGMAGKFHSDDAKDRMSAAQYRAWHSGGYKLIRRGGKRPWKAGWRTVGGSRCYFRSKWEANYARYLEWLRGLGRIKSWRHEKVVFTFPAIKRGIRSFLPDFQVIESDGTETFHEVKGWMDNASRTKLSRMEKFYPEVVIVLIEKRQYLAIQRQIGSSINGWE